MYWHGSIQLALPEGLVFVNLGPGFMNLAPRVYQSWAEGSRIPGGEREKKRERERETERERESERLFAGIRVTAAQLDNATDLATQ